MVMIVQNFVDGEGNILPDFIAWTVKESSEKTGYNEEHIRWLIREGYVNAVKQAKVWLIEKDSLLAYIETTKTKKDGSPDERHGPKK